MTAISSQIPLVDRKHELEELKNHLNNAAQGQGNLLFIAGEAGVGKTRLLDELKSYAQSQGVKILQGWSLYESLTPYMPFVEALRSANLDHLFSREDPPKVECIYLITDTGLLIKEVVREETKLDSTIFAGMLTAVGEFVKDSLNMLSGEEKKEALNTLGYQNYRILIESGRNTNLVVILIGRENEFLINDMREILLNVEEQFGNILKTWDGDDSSVGGIDILLKSLITSGKYDGIDYAKDDPKVKRNRLFENILLGIERHSKGNPSLLCIEDLQWIDPSSLALMHYVARNTRKCNLLILGTYRPEDVSATKEGKVHYLIESMQLMNREDLYQKIELGRLEKIYMDEMLTSLLGKANFTDEFKKHLYKETEGNPFFIVELIRMLIEEKTIEQRDDVWILTKDLKEVHIPSKVHDVIVRRLDRVKEERREILDIAAVIGEGFTSDILANASKLEKVTLLKQLRTLEQSHKLIRSFGVNYKFDHAKIKEVLYNKIPEELKMEYHTIVASSIETLNKDNLDDVIGDLAFHYYHSRNKEKALPYLIKAAEKAKKDYSNEEAIRFYIQALEFEEEPQKRMEIFEDLGESYDLIGNYDMSMDFYNQALELAEKKEEIAGIKARMGDIYQKKGEFDKAINIIFEALKLVRNNGCKEEALAHTNIGKVYFFKGEFGKSIEHYKMGLKIYYDINDERGIGHNLHGIGTVFYYKGEYNEALEYLIKSIEIKEKIGDHPGLTRTLNNIGDLYLGKEEYDSAYDYLNNCCTMCEKIGEQYAKVYSILNIGHIYIGWKDYEKALEYFEKSLKLSNKIGLQRVSGYNYELMAETYLKKGELGNAIYFCEKAIDLFKDLEDNDGMGYAKRVFGMICKVQKKWKESIESFQESINIYKEIGQMRELGNSYYEFGLMWKTRGDNVKAIENLNEALRIFEKLNLKKHIERVEKEL
jgi:predicted ATPase